LGTATTIQATVIAAASGDVSITTEMTATVTINGNRVVFRPLYNTIVSASTSSIIVFGADKIGPLYVPANTIAFDDEVPNLSLMNSLNSVAGTDIESINHLRMRLQQNTKDSEIDRCIGDLNDLPGIVSANVHFNASIGDPETIGGHVIAPRSSIIFVQGFSELIATTYYSNMTAPTTNDTGAQSQNYITKAGQVIPVYFFPPIQKDFFVRLTISILPTEDITTQLRNIVFSLNGLKTIGEQYSLEDVYLVLNNEALSYDVVGVEVSMDGNNWGFITSLQPDEYGNIPMDNISVVEYAA
jgi:hypothetical protein